MPSRHSTHRFQRLLLLTDYPDPSQSGPNPQSVKRCSQCKVEKTLDCFSWSARDRSLSAHCKQCAYKMTKRWRKCDEERHKKTTVDYRLANREKILEKDRIDRAIKRGIPIDAKKTCSKCGIEKLMYKSFGWQAKLKRVRPECRSCEKKWRVAANNVTRNRRDFLHRKYRLTIEDYDALLSGQGGACAICGTDDPKSPGGKHFIVDHDHQTGKIRGLLCNRCNLVLGYLGDNLQGVMRFVDYLQKTTIEIKEQTG